MKKLLFLIAISVLAMALIAVANADVPSLAAAPANSHIIRVTGVGFNASETVKLQLMNGTVAIYNFTEAITTDGAGADLGNFTAIIIAPTNLNGTYNLIASTSTVSKTVAVSLPDLIGPQGEQGLTGEGGVGTQGPQGEQGPQGIQGPAGEDAPAWLLIIAVIALVTAIFSIIINVLLYKVSK